MSKVKHKLPISLPPGQRCPKKQGAETDLPGFRTMVSDFTALRDEPHPGVSSRRGEPTQGSCGVVGYLREAQDGVPRVCVSRTLNADCVPTIREVPEPAKGLCLVGTLAVVPEAIRP